MKVKNQAKKTFMVGLAGIIASQPMLQASNYWDDVLDNSLSNVTPGGKIVEKDASGNVMQRTFYTGSVSFKFGPAFDYPPPIINLSGPKISAGCGGLSIKGMFGSIIGLDRLEGMLKNAGASLAWGIAVGLIYSLPGIGAAFKMINNWAKKIQQLLANACQSGMAIGQALAESSGLKDNAVSNWLTKTDKAVAGLDESLKTKLKEMGISKYFDDNMTFSMPGGDTPQPEDINDNYREFMINSFLSYSLSTNLLMTYISKLSSSQALAFFEEILWEPVNSVESFEINDFEISFDNGSAEFMAEDLIDYASTASLEQKTIIARAIMSTGIIRHSGSDIMLRNPDGAQSYFESIEVLMDTSSTVDEKKEAEAKLIPLITDKEKAYGFVPDTAGNNHTRVAEALTNYLISGNTNGDTESANAIRKFNMKSLNFGSIVLPGAAEDNPTAAKVLVFYAKSKAETGEPLLEIKSNEKGALQRSRDLINALVAPTGLSVDFDALISSSGIALLVPGIIDKIKILQQTAESDREGYVEILAVYNAYHTVRASLVNLLDRGGMGKPYSPAIFIKDGSVKLAIKKIAVSEDRQEQFGRLMTSNRKISLEIGDKAMEILKDNFKDVETPMALEEIFHKLDLKNKTRALKAAGK